MNGLNVLCYVKGVTETLQAYRTLEASCFRTCVPDVTHQCVLQAITVKKKSKDKNNQLKFVQLTTNKKCIKKSSPFIALRIRTNEMTIFIALDVLHWWCQRNVRWQAVRFVVVETWKIEMLVTSYMEFISVNNQLRTFI